MVTQSDIGGEPDELAGKLIQFVELWDSYRHILNPVPVRPDQDLAGAGTGAFGVPKRALEHGGQPSRRAEVQSPAEKRDRKAA